ncbi:hypothetical protein Micbo1qcDRAFT_169815 [Microdochium bolleyi]|uniref:Uncharacterized protein n=1 Tax=Microdochium bolleyi TaxID=196109 RepID=A0A136IIY1_9PEZI|nr:hypothetical protein Micbo1qcDRAFT_169815 [Microdochium bolleyi]
MPPHSHYHDAILATYRKLEDGTHLGTDDQKTINQRITWLFEAPPVWRPNKKSTPRSEKETKDNYRARCANRKYARVLKRNPFYLLPFILCVSERQCEKSATEKIIESIPRSNVPIDVNKTQKLDETGICAGLNERHRSLLIDKITREYRPDEQPPSNEPAPPTAAEDPETSYEYIFASTDHLLGHFGPQLLALNESYRMYEKNGQSFSHNTVTTTIRMRVPNELQHERNDALISIDIAYAEQLANQIACRNPNVTNNPQPNADKEVPKAGDSLVSWDFLAAFLPSEMLAAVAESQLRQHEGRDKRLARKTAAVKIELHDCRQPSSGSGTLTMRVGFESGMRLVSYIYKAPKI